jgi:hypothetical protein
MVGATVREEELTVEALSASWNRLAASRRRTSPASNAREGAFERSIFAGATTAGVADGQDNWRNAGSSKSACLRVTLSPCNHHDGQQHSLDLEPVIETGKNTRNRKSRMTNLHYLRRSADVRKNACGRAAGDHIATKGGITPWKWGMSDDLSNKTPKSNEKTVNTIKWKGM